MATKPLRHKVALGYEEKHVKWFDTFTSDARPKRPKKSNVPTDDTTHAVYIQAHTRSTGFSVGGNGSKGREVNSHFENLKYSEMYNKSRTSGITIRRVSLVVENANGQVLAALTFNAASEVEEIPSRNRAFRLSFFRMEVASRSR